MSAANFSATLVQKAEPVIFSLIRHTPFPPQKFILERALKQLLLEPMADGDLDFLDNASVQISVTDAGIGWQLSYQENQICISPSDGTADATISGKSKAFLQLVSRQEDPDTLFFRRELCIEGDTELGLEVKNLLDSIELPSVAQKALKGLTRLVATK